MTKTLSPVTGTLELRVDQMGLAVIDVQERLAAAMPERAFRRNFGKMILLVEAARWLGLPVLLSEQYPKGLGNTVPALAATLGRLPAGALHRFEKRDFDCVRVGPWRTAVRGSRRSQWILVGMEAHVCVFQTARSLLAMGMTVHVPRDAVVSRSKTDWKTGLRLMDRAGAIVTSAETAVFDLLGTADSEVFKKLSPVIKRAATTD